MRSWIEDATGVRLDPPADAATAAVHAGEWFWLDLEDPTDDAIDHLAQTIGLHPLAVADSKEFGQRGKSQPYGNVAMIVSFGVEHGEPYEFHAYHTAGFLVTLRRGPSSAFDELHQRRTIMELFGHDPICPLHGVITSLLDQFRSVIDSMDDRLDDLETRVVSGPAADQVIQIAQMNQQANVLRRSLTAGRDVSSRATIIEALPGATADSTHYVADVSQELWLIVADLAAITERCRGLLGLHTSLSNNSQGVASRQLAAIATVFLPITFIVGFFGMNFTALLDHVQVGWAAFLLLGIGLNVACVVVTFMWIGRRGWR